MMSLKYAAVATQNHLALAGGAPRVRCDWANKTNGFTNYVVGNLEGLGYKWGLFITVAVIALLAAGLSLSRARASGLIRIGMITIACLLLLGIWWGIANGAIHGKC